MEKEKRKIHSYFGRSELIALGLVALLIVFGVGLDVADQPFYEKYRGWLLLGLTIVFLYGALPALVRCARCGNRVPIVCAGSLGILVILLAAMYTAYFWIVTAVDSTQVPQGSDKLLNLPPLLAALWTAGLGWYVHFQASAKNHRTTNAFNLLMQTRINPVFMEKANAAQDGYPHGTLVPVGDELYIKTQTLSALKDQMAAQDPANPDADLHAQYKKAMAAEGLKYLLNFYEFMAVGIEARDLDENLLYETLGVTAPSVFSRSQVFVRYIRSPGGGNQPLAFEQLEKLADRWDKLIRDEIHELSQNHGH